MNRSLNHRYFLRLSFNGESFHGWQSQHNALSIQSTLREALTVVLREPVEVTGAGRTDAGVHAREFYAHFDHAAELSISERRDLIFHLNGFLPDAISILEILPVQMMTLALAELRHLTAGSFSLASKVTTTE